MRVGQGESIGCRPYQGAQIDVTVHDPSIEWGLQGAIREGNIGLVKLSLRSAHGCRRAGKLRLRRVVVWLGCALRSIERRDAIEAEFGLFEFRLGASQLSLGLLHLIQVVLLPYHCQHGSFLYPVPLVDVAHASAWALDLANTID